MNSKLLKKSFQNVPRRSYNISDALWLSVKKMSYKIITYSLIITLLLSPTVNLLQAQEIEIVTGDEEIDPEIFNMIRTQAMERKQYMLNMLGEGPYSPDVENSLQHAEQAMIQAQNYEENNPKESTQSYLRAIKQYRNALIHYLEENPEETIEFEPQDTTSAESEVEVITQEEIDSARTMLVSRFQERFQEQIQQMIHSVDDLEDELSPDDAFKAREAIRHTLEKTLRIQEKIQSGQIDEAVDDLDEATEELEDDLDDVIDPGTAQMLKAMYRLEARIQKMVQKAFRKAAAGEDTSVEDALLDELRGNKNNMKDDFKESQGNGGQQGDQGGQGKGKN